MILILRWSRILCGESQNFDISREIGPGHLDLTREMSKFCDSPHVMRDLLSVKFKAKTIGTGAYHFCFITCAASKVPQGKKEKNQGLSFQNSAIVHPLYGVS